MTASECERLLYVDIADDFSEQFASALDTNEAIQIDKAMSVNNALNEFDHETYDAVLTSEHVDWTHVQSQLTGDHQPLILFVDESDAVSEAFEAAVTDCVSRQDPALQASILSERFHRNQYTIPTEQTGHDTYNQLLASDELIIYTLDSNGRLTMASREFAQRMDEPQEEIIGSPVTEYISEEAYEDGYELVEELLAREDQEWGSREFQIDHGGETYWYRNYLTPLVDEGDEFDGMIGVLFDITDHRERLDELELYEMMVESIPEMVWAMDEYGNYIYANRTHADYGIDPDDLIGSNISQFMSDEELQRVQQRIQETFYERDGEKFVGTYEYESRGQRLKGETHVSLLESESGKLEGLVGIVIDADEQIEREQRLNVVNRIFRHNVRNTLTVVKGAISVISEEVGGTAKKQAELIENRADELEGLSEKAKSVGDILRNEQDQRQTDLVTVAEKLVTVYSDADVTFETEFPDEATAYAIEGIEFAIENLIENAVEHNERDDLVVRITIEQTAESVVLTVEDNGPGIPDDEIAAIEQGKEESLVHASGIGLWAVNWIVNRSRGELEFGESEGLGGAAVQIQLSRQGLPNSH